MGIGKSVSAVNTPLLHPLSALSVIPSSSTKMVKSQSRKSSVSSPSPVLDGRVRKAAVSEQVEMQLYLSKLKELVPNMPKDRKVSKVEVINNVIDYICDLQMALDVHHHAALVSVILNNNNSSSSNNNNNNNNNNVVVDPTAARQPLCVIPTAPNAFANTCAQEMNPLDKSSSCADCSSSRTVSC